MLSTIAEMEALPAAPYLALPSGSPSRAGHHHHHHRPRVTSPHSSSAALLQADLFSASAAAPACMSATNLFRFRLIAAGWLFAAAIWLPVCEWQGGSCAVGVARVDSEGELGTLAGWGHPNPGPTLPPTTPHVRTLWMLASLSYMLSALLCAYFLLMILLAATHRILLKHTMSYPYASLCVSSHASSAAYPLTWAQKVVALLFQLAIPTSIGLCFVYWIMIVHDRKPPGGGASWFVSVHLHLITCLLAMIELFWNRLIFRLKALVYWFGMCLVYLLFLTLVFISSTHWAYHSLDWKSSLMKAELTWIFGPLFLGPGMFFTCALIQYARDGWTRGLFTSARDIESAAHAKRVAQATHAQSIASRGAYIHGALSRYALDAFPSEFSTPVRPARSGSSASLNGSPDPVRFPLEEEPAAPVGVVGQIRQSVAWLRSWWTTEELP